MVIDLEPKNRVVGRPRSVNSPGNPGFLVVFHPGSPDSFARLSRQASARSTNLMALPSFLLASTPAEHHSAMLDLPQNSQFGGISAVEGR